MKTSRGARSGVDSRSVLPPFQSLLDEHGAALLAFCRVQAGNTFDGDDIFQEAMLAALRAYPTVRDPEMLRSWLYTIAARKAIDAHRARARRPVPTERIADLAGSTEDDYADGAVWQAVRELPPKQRQAVTLRFLGDMTYEDIAAVMDTTAAAARRNVFEALKRLRDLTPELSPAS